MSKMTPEETLMKYWGFDKLLTLAKKEAAELEVTRVNLVEEIASLHTIMATPELMEMWLDGKHMKAHTLSVKMMQQFAQATEDATKESQ